MKHDQPCMSVSTSTCSADLLIVEPLVSGNKVPLCGVGLICWCSVKGGTDDIAYDTIENTRIYLCFEGTVYGATCRLAC